MPNENSYKEWFVFTKSKGGISLDNSQLFFSISLVIVGITSVIRQIFLDRREFEQYSRWCADCPEPGIISSVLEGGIAVVFHLILYLIVQLAYTDNSKAIAKVRISYASQLWALADILYLIRVIIISFRVDSNQFFDSSYYILWAAATILSLFYIGKPIIDRLNTSFDDYSKTIFAAIILSALIYWVSYGLTQILRLLILLPFGGV